MKKLLLSLLAVAGAWTSTSAQSEIPGYIYHNTVETLTLNRASLDCVSDGKLAYSKDYFTCTLVGDASITYLGDNDKCLALNRGKNFTFDWESNNSSVNIKVTSFSIKTACFRLTEIGGATVVSVNNEESINIGGLNPNKADDNAYKTASTSSSAGLPHSISIVYANVLEPQYICNISSTYELKYYALDFTEFDEAYNEAAAIYRMLSPEEQDNSDFGKAVKAAEAFRNANDGAVDVVNGTKPAQVDEETEKLRALLYTANIPDGVDMTSYIKNNSFEMGDLTDWTMGGSPNNDNGVRGDIANTGRDGNFLFNTWREEKAYGTGTSAWSAVSYYPGYPISQTITGLPNGTYEVSALLSSDNNNTTFLTINGENAKDVKSPNKDTFIEAKTTVVVTDGMLTIGAQGGEATAQGKKGIGGGTPEVHTYNTWYRADNFQLKLIKADTYRLSEAVDYVKPEGERKKVILKKEMKAGKYSAVCLPFDYTPSGWTVYTLSNEEERDNGSTLAISLQPVTGTLTAGHPYFVCPLTDVETITVNDVTLISEPQTVDNIMPLVGIFEATLLNAGDIYVSTTADDMTFKYLKAGATATLKPYRAYFKNDGVNASTFRVNTEDNSLTSILDALNEKQNDGIYDINGRRTNTLKPGIYVVDGKKVIIK